MEHANHTKITAAHDRGALLGILHVVLQHRSQALYIPPNFSMLPVYMYTEYTEKLREPGKELGY